MHRFLIVILFALACGFPCSGCSDPKTKVKPNTDTPTAETQTTETQTTKTPTESNTRDPRPNIVLIYSDDVDCESVFGDFPRQPLDTIAFPNLKALAQAGIRFSNFHVTTPVCGPSRACLYTGQYAHRHQCKVNDSNLSRALGFSGGYSNFDPQNELAIWMKRAGYRTAHVGKYLHNEFTPDHANGIKWNDIVPPGWDEFCVTLGSRYRDFPSFVKSKDEFCRKNQEYRTDWDIRHAIDVIQAHAKSKHSNKPLMLCWSPIAAHITSQHSPMVAPRHKSLYADAALPDRESRLAQKVNGQIEEMKAIVAPDESRLQYITKVYRDRLRTMTGIDEGIGALRDQLKSLGMLENTIFIFTSDHGIRFTQHGHMGKRLPYDRITRVPFIVSGPGIPKGRQCDQLLANIDITPTLVAIAGEPTPESCDGKSFAKLLTDPDDDSFQRDAIVIENWGQSVSNRIVLPATYNSLRMHDSIFTQWATGGLEYYNLRADPEQLDNLYDQLEPQRQQELAAKLRSKRNVRFKPIIAAIDKPATSDDMRLCPSLTPLELAGYVESDGGIKKVELELRCKASGDFWTGDGWSPVRHRFNANLAQPTGLSSKWSYTLDTRAYAIKPNVDLKAQDVRLVLFATDIDNRRNSKDALSFKLSFADPETKITSHRISANSKTELMVSGTAEDHNAISAVKVSFENPNTRRFWTGNKWSNDYVDHVAILAPISGSQKNQSWQISIPVPKCPKLFVIARAYNATTHFDHTPAIETVELD